MAFSLVAHSTGANTATTAVDTTGATLLIAFINNFSGGAPVVGDNKGNTWVQIGTTLANGSTISSFWYVTGPLVVGSGHTVIGGGAGFYSICFQAWYANGRASPLDLTSQAAAFQAGSVTPSQDNELLVAACAPLDTQSASAISGGFTISDNVAYAPGVNEATALAYLIQTSAAAANPTWTASGGAPGTFIATFILQPYGKTYLPKPGASVPYFNASHPLAAGVLAAWPFVEAFPTSGTGSTINTWPVREATGRWGPHGNPNPGSVGADIDFQSNSGQPVPVWQSGPWGAEVSFNTSSGVDGYVNNFLNNTTITPPFTIIVAATQLTAAAASTYRSLFAFRTAGGIGPGLFVGNAASSSANFATLAGVWNGVSTEYDAATGILPTVGIPFVAALVALPNSLNIYFYDQVSGVKTWTLSETLNSLNYSGASPFHIGSDSGVAATRGWPGSISNVVMISKGISLNEFQQWAQDPFVIYRKPSRWWEIPFPAVGNPEITYRTRKRPAAINKPPGIPIIDPNAAINEGLLELYLTATSRNSIPDPSSAVVATAGHIPGFAIDWPGLVSSFNGSSQYFTTSKLSGFNSALQPWTIALTFTPKDNGDNAGNGVTLFGTGINSGNFDGIWIGWGPGFGTAVDQTLNFGIVANTAISHQIGVRTTNTLTIGKPTRAVMSYNGNGDVSGLSLVLDGTVPALTTISNTLAGNNSFTNRVWGIGCTNDGTASFFNGNIDNIRVYNRVVTAGEAEALCLDPWAGLLFPSNLTLFAEGPVASIFSVFRDFGGIQRENLERVQRGGRSLLVTPNRI